MNVIRTKVVPRFVALCTDSVQRAFFIIGKSSGPSCDKKVLRAIALWRRMRDCIENEEKRSYIAI